MLGRGAHQRSFVTVPSAWPYSVAAASGTWEYVEAPVFRQFLSPETGERQPAEHDGPNGSSAAASKRTAAKKAAQDERLPQSARFVAAIAPSSIFCFCYERYPDRGRKTCSELVDY